MNRLPSMGSVRLKKNISHRRQYKSPVLWIQIRMDWSSGSGSRSVKKTHKKGTSEEMYCFGNAGRSLLMTGGLTCRFDVLHGGLVHYHFWPKQANFFVNCKIFQWSRNLWIWNLIRIRIDLKCWIRIRIKTNADPHQWKNLRVMYFAAESICW